MLERFGVNPPCIVLSCYCAIVQTGRLGKCIKIMQGELIFHNATTTKCICETHEHMYSAASSTIPNFAYFPQHTPKFTQISTKSPSMTLPQNLSKFLSCLMPTPYHTKPEQTGTNNLQTNNLPTHCYNKRDAKVKTICKENTYPNTTELFSVCIVW